MQSVRGGAGGADAASDSRAPSGCPAGAAGLAEGAAFGDVPGSLVTLFEGRVSARGALSSVSPGSSSDELGWSRCERDLRPLLRKLRLLERDLLPWGNLVVTFRSCLR